MDMISAIQEHFSESIQTKILAADYLPSYIAQAAELMTEALL